MSKLPGKQVLLAVGGGIAAYKAPELVRRLMDAGAAVQVAMTPAARAFITPLTLQAVSHRQVAMELLDPGEDAAIGHIRLADECDVAIVAPATADLISRMAAGRADDIVTATLLATRAPVVVAPAMNTNMLEHPAVRANIARLAEFGHHIVEPDSGELACGYEGRGRLPDAPVLVEAIEAALTPQDLAGCRVLISAGPTREPIDPVRVLTNRSSGRMGFALAAAARRRGAAVALVAGPTNLEAPRGCDLISVETAVEMYDAMRAAVTAADVVIMVAAVADYRPASPADRKIKKGSDALTLELEKTDDILTALSAARGERILVGFAAETHDVIAHAQEKLRRKQLDLIVANDVSASDRGFDVDTNAATLLDRDGGSEEIGLVTKAELADRILDRVVLLRSPVRSIATRSR